jgi:hypothetical protein
MPLTTDPHTHEITYNGRLLAPGDTFEPFPDAHPGYTVAFVGVLEEDDGTPRVHLRDNNRAVSVPLADIPQEVTA